MHVTDPTGIPLNVRGFDGKVIGALHNGKIVEILRTSADTTGKSLGPMPPMRPTEELGLSGSGSWGPETPQRAFQSRVPIAILIGRFSSMRRA